MGHMPRAVGICVPFLGCSEQLVQGPAGPKGRVVPPGQALLCQGWGHGDSYHCWVFFPAALPLWSIFFPWQVLLRVNGQRLRAGCLRGSLITQVIGLLQPRNCIIKKKSLQTLQMRQPIQ